MLMESNCFEYEYPRKIEGVDGNFFLVPEEIISTTFREEDGQGGYNPSVFDISKLDKIRVSAFSYLSIRRGLDNRVLFFVNDIVRWMQKKPDRHSDGINTKLSEVIWEFQKSDYISCLTNISSKESVELIYDYEKVKKICEKQRFAVIYLDELNKIINYKNPNSKDPYLNNDVILLVFAYLRMKIRRRSNKLSANEINIENKNSHEYDIETRRSAMPDAYNCYYMNIAEELNISVKAVSKAVQVLYEMELIYFERLPRIKIDDKWRTDFALFCNWYKRESGYNLISGEEYYSTEIENKKKKLKIKDWA